MAQQLQSHPHLADLQPAPRRGGPVKFGMIGAFLGGALGGLAGGAAGGPIGTAMRGPVANIAMPATDELLLGLASGALLGAGAGALLGGPGGWLVGKLSGRRGAFFAMLASAAAAALIAPIESCRAGVLTGLIGLVLGTIGMTLLCLAVNGFIIALVRWRLLRWGTVAWLLLCLAGAVYNNTLPPANYSRSTDHPAEPTVQLRSAPLPPPLGLLSRHCWFATYDPGQRRWHRWEVWQFRGADHKSWEHLRKDFMHVDNGVGGGPYEVIAEWQGDQARALLAAIESAPTRYARRDCYIAWPGPNCNTYIAWVLSEAEIAAPIHPLAVGQHFDGCLGACVTAGCGVQMETATVGGRIGLHDGIELHVLTMPVGIDVLAPAIITPAGRCGFAR